MKDEAGLALAIDDARSHMSAVVALITTADQQAMSLLGIYLSPGRTSYYVLHKSDDPFKRPIR